ncbi:MAG TPA: helix-turn-helix domain-containing protein [Humisphaera sp.]|jgi:excisionase family DNA binding protein|nr:helix-turn-helix domain-containing protein [Humisphaera sp.]
MAKKKKKKKEKKKPINGMITVLKAADWMDISPRQVRNLIHQGVVPAKKVGRDFLINGLSLARVPDRKPGPKPGSKHGQDDKTP